MDIPLKHWFAEGGPLREELSDRLSSMNARIFHYFRPDAVQRLISEHNVDSLDHSERLWQLLFWNLVCNFCG